MPDALTLLLPKLAVLAFVFAFGACIGSLVNVLVYRIPRGLGVVIPSSRCPSCGTRLSFRENIPILGWLILRGRCRHCDAPISPEYPIVETIVALLFGAIYTLWYIVEPGAHILGIPIGAIAPEWAHNGASETWPALVVLLVLMGSLVAMTIIDARTFTIPLALTWVPALVALVFHGVHGIWFSVTRGRPIELAPGQWRFEHGFGTWDSAPGWLWTIPTPAPGDWSLIGLIAGGALGLLIANALLAAGLVSRSFGDYDQWLESRRDVQVDGAAGDPTIEDAASPAHDWIQYPHARREMVRELAFLSPSILLAMGGAWLAPRLVTWIHGPWAFDPSRGAMTAPVEAPLWVLVLAGVVGGYLIGGAVVWGVRILGSLAFNKEAMGLGDVHLMACVGACLGWIDATIAFFLAAFVALGIALAGAISRASIARAMPYGPSLAIATVLVVFAKPLVERGLGMMFAMQGPYAIP